MSQTQSVAAHRQTPNALATRPVVLGDAQAMQIGLYTQPYSRSIVDDLLVRSDIGEEMVQRNEGCTQGLCPGRFLLQMAPYLEKKG